MLYRIRDGGSVSIGLIQDSEDHPAMPYVKFLPHHTSLSLASDPISIRSRLLHLPPPLWRKGLQHDLSKKIRERQNDHPLLPRSSFVPQILERLDNRGAMKQTKTSFNKQRYHSSPTHRLSLGAQPYLTQAISGEGGILAQNNGTKPRYKEDLMALSSIHTTRGTRNLSNAA